MDFARAFDPIRAFQSAWRLLTRSPAPLLLGGIILVLTDGNWGFGWHEDEHGHLRGGELIGILACGGCIGLVFFLIRSWISLGLANAVEKTIVEGHARAGDVFDARGRFFEMVLGAVLVFLIVLGSLIPFAAIALGAVFAHQTLHVPEGAVLGVALLAAVVWLVVWLHLLIGISLWRQAIAIEGLAPTAAIQRSWSLVRGHRLRLLLYWIVIVVFSLVGLCLCCVGVLFTGSLGWIAPYESYLALTRPEVYARSWLAAPEPAPGTSATL